MKLSSISALQNQQSFCFEKSVALLSREYQDFIDRELYTVELLLINPPGSSGFTFLDFFGTSLRVIDNHLEASL